MSPWEPTWTLVTTIFPSANFTSIDLFEPYSGFAFNSSWYSWESAYCFASTDNRSSRSVMAFQCQTFLRLQKLLLKTGASAESDNLVILNHINHIRQFSFPSHPQACRHDQWQLPGSFPQRRDLPQPRRTPCIGHRDGAFLLSWSRSLVARR